MAARKDKAATATYSDHEVIYPENTLRKAIVKPGAKSAEDDAVARAEMALADLSGEFGGWMDDECAKLDKARQACSTLGFTPANKSALFLAAHDIRGQAATLGYPALAGTAKSLCRLIEFTPNPTRIPIKLVEQHVDAVRAIYREYARSDAKELAQQLTKRLREVADEFLIGENADQPDVLAQIRSPSLVPE